MAPTGCLLCRREQAAAAPEEPTAPVTPAAPAAQAQGATAPVAAAPVAAAPVAAAPAAAVPAPVVSAAPVPPPSGGFAPVAVPLAALTPKLDAVADHASAAPATAMDSLPARQFSVRITPQMLWLPVAALLGYLILTNLPESPAAREAASARNAVGLGAAGERAPDPHGGEEGEDEGPAAGDLADGDDSAEPAPPEASPALPPALTREQTKKLELAKARGQLKVTMYYTDWCQNCLEARGYLAGRGIRVESLDIEKDAKARAKHKKLNPRGSVPTIVVEGKVLVGFSTQRLDKAIDKAARARVAKSSKSSKSSK